MRSYQQYCAVAKALDVIGDRWTLLIVRELLIRGPCRYTDLTQGLPGIATNLLTDRLRDLETAGIVRRDPATPPFATDMYRLTERGEALEPVLHELGRWGAPFLAAAPRKDAFHCHWLAVPAKAHLKDLAPDRPPVTLEVRSGDESMTVEADAGTVHIRPGASPAPDAVLNGTRDLVLGVLTGRLELRDATSKGLRYEGNPGTLRRFVKAESSRR